MLVHNFIDMAGQKYGRLTVIRRVDDKVLDSGRRKVMWLCLCDCGKYKTIAGESLRSGRARSCGCRKAEPLVRYSTRHGKRHERIYDIYCDMKKRCYNSKSRNYKYYGGKGVKICDEWLSDFMSFYEWSMKHGYTDDLSIDRIDSSGNYEPSNCQWITRSENVRRRNIEYWERIHENNKSKAG